MGLEVEDDARDAAFLQLLFQLGQHLSEVAEDAFVPAVAEMGGDEVLQHIFVDVLRAALELRVVIVLDVHPADAGLHE